MNKLDIKIAFFDIDGTLTNKDRILTNETINTLNKLNELGIKIVLCSGRPNNYLYDLSKKVKGIRYGISSNGAQIFDYLNKKIVYDNKIDSKDLNIVWNYTINNKYEIIINSDFKRYINIYTNNNKNDFILLNDLNIIKNNNIYQLVINFNNYDEMNKIKDYINKNTSLKVINCSFDYLNKSVYGYHWFDVVNNNVSKGSAIKILLNKLNIDKSNSICFGDSINDIEMFNECGIKVAMGNALNELKQISDYITDTNDNNGISKFFNENLFNNKK